ncbi:hypothetical protein Taro_035199 [Colocasia esculenta]|uniref:Uncharacterized protein n=1 Tax=Colocasia esculenta TaxID=4460 RepID=A0A843WHW8_COLES|nr:hypothetical protein [Colocasia esculenta]
MDPTLCPVWITVARKSRRPKMKKPLQKHRAVLRCYCCNWSLLPYHWGYLWLNRCCLRGRWWLLLYCHLCELLTSCRYCQGPWNIALHHCSMTAGGTGAETTAAATAAAVAHPAAMECPAVTGPQAA